jgi:hypothetical protein
MSANSSMRFLRSSFRQVETQSRLQFGRLAATQRAVLDASAAAVSASGGSSGGNAEEALRVAHEEHRARWCELLPALRVRLRLLGLLGLLFVAFGPSYRCVKRSSFLLQLPYTYSCMIIYQDRLGTKRSAQRGNLERKRYTYVSHSWLLLHLLYGEAWSSTEAPVRAETVNFPDGRLLRIAKYSSNFP